MNENKFEPLTLQTIKELRALREFAHSMIALNAIHDMPVPHEMREKILELNRFYNEQEETYPV